MITVTVRLVQRCQTGKDVETDAYVTVTGITPAFLSEQGQQEELAGACASVSIRELAQHESLSFLLFLPAGIEEVRDEAVVNKVWSIFYNSVVASHPSKGRMGFGARCIYPRK
jgi:hypothetical protein